MTPVNNTGQIIPAHTQLVTVHLVYNYPEHGPRGDAFEAAKERMKQLGLVHCVVPGCDTFAPIEYHHTWVENAMQNGIDVTKLDGIAGLELTDEEFTVWVQSPGNLEPLCSVHHRTQLGIHHIPEPDWNALRAWKNGIPEPVEVAPTPAPAGSLPAGKYPVLERLVAPAAPQPPDPDYTAGVWYHFWHLYHLK